MADLNNLLEDETLLRGDNDYRYDDDEDYDNDNQQQQQQQQQQQDHTDDPDPITEYDENDNEDNDNEDVDANEDGDEAGQERNNNRGTTMSPTTEWNAHDREHIHIDIDTTTTTTEESAQVSSQLPNYRNRNRRSSTRSSPMVYHSHHTTPTRSQTTIMETPEPLQLQDVRLQTTAAREEEEESDEAYGTPDEYEATETNDHDPHDRDNDTDALVHPRTNTATTSHYSNTSNLNVLYRALKHWWTQEIRSPELVPYDQYGSDLIARIVDALAEQEEAIWDISRPCSSTNNKNLDSLLASMIKVDVNRCKFLLCNLIKERLRKLEEHPWYWQKKHMTEMMTDNVNQKNNNNHNNRKRMMMSVNEVEYLNAYVQLLESHLHKTVLDHFPPEQIWKRLDQANMIDAPDLSTYVFASVLRDQTVISNDNSGTLTMEEYDAGQSIIVCYAQICDLIRQGRIELLM